LNILLAKTVTVLVYDLRYAGRLVVEPHSLFREAYVMPVFKWSVLLAAPNYGAWKSLWSILKLETEKEKEYEKI
jgi:hypothetical protein